MKIFVYTRGDRSVGIPSGHIVLDGVPCPQDAEDREVIREILKSAFSEIMDEIATVVFQDEAQAEEKMFTGEKS